MTKFGIVLIRFYRYLISPFLPPSCRFYPTCSQYGLEALETHGLGFGSWLVLRRVLRCHPLHPGGYDPIPGRLKRPSGTQSHPVA